MEIKYKIEDSGDSRWLYLDGSEVVCEWPLTSSYMSWHTPLVAIGQLIAAHPAASKSSENRAAQQPIPQHWQSNFCSDFILEAAEGDPIVAKILRTVELCRVYTEARKNYDAAGVRAALEALFALGTGGEPVTTFINATAEWPGGAIEAQEARRARGEVAYRPDLYPPLWGPESGTPRPLEAAQ